MAVGTNTAITSPTSNPQLTEKVNTEAAQLEADQRFIAANKDNAGVLAGAIGAIQEHWKAFQADSSTLQNTGNGTDIGAAWQAEKRAFSAFDSTHADLKDAVSKAQGSPEAAVLQAGYASITDQGNANALHLQAINNNFAGNNTDGTGVNGQYTVDNLDGGEDANRALAQGISRYGSSDGTGIADGGTVSVAEIARQATDIYQGSGKDRTDDGHLPDYTAIVGVK